MTSGSENPLLRLEGSAFLREWHARYPGAASSAFGYGRAEGGEGSSYDLLVDDAAAVEHLTTAVDLACGDGHLVELLARRLPTGQIIGVDMAPEELDVARHRSLLENVRLINARAEALPLPDASADAVVCHMALMLFDDARSVVNELARVIRPGGVFAAVLGPAPGNSELVARFGALLREAEAAEQLPPLQVGDRLTFAEDTLLAILQATSGACASNGSLFDLTAPTTKYKRRCSLCTTSPGSPMTGERSSRNASRTRC
ncbi:MAG: class I SAM-dependent methyltransferase [Candidatus Cybelea sp.]